MLRSIFGGKEEDHSGTMATKTSAITAAEFKAALGRYPALIKSMTKERMYYFCLYVLGGCE